MPDRLPIALLALRLTLGVFLLQWAVEKFVVPSTTIGIFQRFYGLDMGAAIIPAIGAVQVLLALAFLIGFAPRITYSAVLAMHTVTTVVTIPRLMAPWNPVSNHLFIAGVPVLAAFFALWLLRAYDRWTVPNLLAARAATVPAE